MAHPNRRSGFMGSEVRASQSLLNFVAYAGLLSLAYACKGMKSLPEGYSLRQSVGAFVGFICFNFVICVLFAFVFSIILLGATLLYESFRDRDSSKG